MHIYRISREYYANFCDHQREELLSEFELDTNGDILIPYEHKGYTCNDLKVESSHGIKAVSMFHALVVLIIAHSLRVCLF